MNREDRQDWHRLLATKLEAGRARQQATWAQEDLWRAQGRTAGAVLACIGFTVAAIVQALS